MGSDRQMTLGEFLRSEREQRGITLEQVASATKVGIRTLHALEGDHYAELPAKPYIRGFVASYCAFIGLDPNEVRAQYEDFIQVKSQERPNRDAGHSGYAFEKKDGQQESRILLFIAMCSFLVIGGITMFVVKPSLKHRRSSHIEKLKQADEQEQKLIQAHPSPLVSPLATPSPVNVVSSAGNQAVASLTSSSEPSPSGTGGSLAEKNSVTLTRESTPLDLTPSSPVSLRSSTPLLDLGESPVRSESIPDQILPSPNVSIPKLPPEEPTRQEELKVEAQNLIESQRQGQEGSSNSVQNSEVLGPSPSIPSRVQSSPSPLAPSPSPLATMSTSSVSQPLSTPSPLPSVGINAQDPLDSGHDLNGSDVKHRLVFNVQKDVWVRYRVDERPTRKFVIRAGRSLVLKAQNRVVFQVSDPAAVTFIHNQAGSPQVLSESNRMKRINGEATLSYAEAGVSSGVDVLHERRPLPKQVEPKREGSVP